MLLCSDNDELKHSMRSVLANFRHYTRQFHVVTSDFTMPYNLSFPKDWRLGQVPQWLDPTQKTWLDDDVALSLIHHAEIFEPYKDTTFNRYANSSNISNRHADFATVTELNPSSVIYKIFLNICKFWVVIQAVSIYSPTFFSVYMVRQRPCLLSAARILTLFQNDDFYMSNPLTPRSFYTSGKYDVSRAVADAKTCITVYGLVLRYDLAIMVGPDKPSPDEPHGEWRSMGESNVLLSQCLSCTYTAHKLIRALFARCALWCSSSSICPTRG